MRKIIILMVAALLVTAGFALAVPGGKVLEYKNSSMGTVKFDGELHKKAGATCKECHVDGMFPQKKMGSVKITMEQIYAGKLCGACHNGKKAFEAKGNCQRCHVPAKK